MPQHARTFKATCCLKVHNRSNFCSQLNLLQFTKIFIQSEELVKYSFVLIGQILRCHTKYFP